MALSYVQYQGTGSRVTFPVPFPYLSKSHVVVRVDGLVKTVTWDDAQTIRVTPAPANGIVIEIRRSTPNDVRLVDFVDGSVLTETDLDTSTIQTFYVVQEAIDIAGGTLGVDPDGSFNALGRRITNMGDPVGGGNAVTKRYFDGTFLPQMQALLDASTAARDTTLGYRNTAGTHATTATTQAGTATTQAGLATTAATNAKTSETNAKTSETNAAGSATTATTQAGIATTKASEASASATTATTQAGLATTQAGQVGTARDAAIAARDTTVGYRDAALTAKVAAETARDKASQWAGAAENTQVDPGLYSAFHWSQKAKLFASGNAAAINYTPSGLIVATDVQAALTELDSKKIAKTAAGTFGNTMLATATSAAARSALDFDNQVNALADTRIANTKGTTVLLSEVNPSNVALVNFTNVFANLDANYDHYILEIDELHTTVADTCLYIRAYTAGNVIQSATGTYDYAGVTSRNDVNSHTGSASTVGPENVSDTLSLTKRVAGYGLASGTFNSINGEVHFYRPGRAKFRCSWDLNYDGNTGTVVSTRGAGRMTANTDVTGFQLAFVGLSGGSPLMTIGALRFYGIKK